MEKMKIAIVGPGAVGLLLAGLLHRHANVTIIDYKKDRCEFLNKNGIQWDGLDEQLNINIPVISGLDSSKHFGLVILCVKAYHTESAVKMLKNAGFSGNLLTLQNGLGNVEIIQEHLKDVNLIAGITSEGATLVDTGHVRHAGRGKTAFGQVISGKPGAVFLSDLMSIMNASNLSVELEADTESLIWGKLIINVGINALTAILKVTNGKLLDLSHARILMSKMVGEAVEIAERKNIKLPFPEPLARVEEVCRLTSKNFSSMYQDISKSGFTEIDFINGAIIREGRKLGISCPYNDSVTKMIKSLEEIRQAELEKK